MSTPRLQQQFMRLWQHFQGKSSDTTLQEIAEVLNCSRRHVRTLLSGMYQQGWLTWSAEAGRGKRSRLDFLYTGLALQQQRAEELLEQDKIDQLVQLVGDKTDVRQMLLSQLGRRFRQGKHILRILYYRPLQNLQPGTPLRRSEVHLARQIFSGLTRLNEENGELQPDIAHHWQEISPKHWRFYLRPAIRFHNGRELEIDDIIATLERLCSQPLFKHLQSIESPTSHVLDIHLSMPDRWLPWLLGSVHAMILPQEWHTIENFARCPIGTGPYAVVQNTNKQLKIRAFDDYFGLRALIDEVSIWVLPELSEDLIISGVQLQMDDSHKDELESRLEEGCYFLLFDRRSPLGSDESLRIWLSQVITPIALLARADNRYQRYWSPAYGVLPRWHHIRSQAHATKPKDLKTVTLTYYSEHNEFHIIAQHIGPLLAEYGVTLVTQKVSYEEWYNGDAVTDIWLGSANFYLPLEFSLFAVLYEIPLIQHCISDDPSKYADSWRHGELSLSEWFQHLVGGHQLHPLFHHWLLLHGQRSMRGVRMNTLGWFDFQSAWFAPPEI